MVGVGGLVAVVVVMVAVGVGVEVGIVVLPIILAKRRVSLGV